MKKGLFTILTCFALSLVCSCSTQKEAPHETPTVAKETPISTNTPKPLASSPATPITETEDDFFSTYGVKKLPEQIELPTNAVETEMKGLYQLDIEVDGLQSLSGLSVVDNTIFACDVMQGNALLFDFPNGNVMSKVSGLGDYMKFGRLSNGGFYTIVQGSLETTFYDRLGKQKVVRKAENYGCASLCYVTQDGEYEIYDNEKGEIICYHMTDGSSQVVYSGSSYNTIVDENDGGCILHKENGDYLFLDIKAATAEVIYDRIKDDSDENYSFLWPFLYSETEEQVSLVPIEDQSKIVSVPKQESKEYVVDCSFGVLATMTNVQSSSISFYNLRTQEVIGKVEAPQNGQFGTIKILDNGFALINCVIDNKVTIYLYDLVSDRTFQSWPVTIKDREQEEETNPVVKELNETYGIKVYYGEKCIFSEGGKHIVSLTEQQTIDTSIQVLKKFLETLPEGMTQEMYEGFMRGINIYLGGTISDDVGVQHSVGGFVSVSSANKINIVLDASVSEIVLTGNLAHEFSHAFEYKIQKMSEISGIDWLEGWEQLNPSSIEHPYYNSYELDDEAFLYTPYGTNGKVWFVDDYSRSFVTEDRARIFENMFVPEDGQISYRINHKNLKYKARYYAVMLRSCFTSCKEADNLVWEQYIGQADKREFTFLNND